MERIDVFENCPAYQSKHFSIRKMKMADAEGLYQCYSNKEAAKYFNGDACEDDFYYTDFERFVKCMQYWESRYRARDFVRFTIIDTDKEIIAGMVEICPSYKYYADGFQMGILRIDILPQYETGEYIEELLNTILVHIYGDFQVRSVLMKAQEYAEVRRRVLKKLHFVPAKEECNISYKDYFIRY